MDEHKDSASGFPRELLNLIDGYVRGRIDRRGFLQGAGRFAVGGVAAAGILDMLSPRDAAAQQVAKDDKRIKAEYVQYDSPKGSGAMKGYLARPVAATGKLPGVLVGCEDSGVGPYIEDATRRLAVAGYLAFAPDPLSSVGGYPGNDEKAALMHAQIPPPKILQDYLAGVGYIKAHPDCTGKLAAVGFGFGADLVNELATRLPDLVAVIPFCGEPVSDQDVEKIKAPLMLHFAEQDDAVNKLWPVFEALLQAANVRYSVYKYPGTQHAFYNDMSPQYNKEQAAVAWQRTLDFLKNYFR